MSLLNKTGWNKLRRARISITLNTIKDLKLKKTVANDIIKQIDNYMDSNGLKDKNIPPYNISVKRTDVPNDLYMKSKKQFILNDNKKYLLDKIEAYNSKKDYRFRWIGSPDQLKKLYDIYLSNDRIDKSTLIDDWLSNFLKKDGLPFNDNGITKIVWFKSNVYLARTLNHLMSKKGKKCLIAEENNEWKQTDKIFCDINRKPFKGLAKSLNQQKSIDGFTKNKKPDEILSKIIKEINSI